MSTFAQKIINQQESDNYLRKFLTELKWEPNQGYNYLTEYADSYHTYITSNKKDSENYLKLIKEKNIPATVKSSNIEINNMLKMGPDTLPATKFAIIISKDYLNKVIKPMQEVYKRLEDFERFNFSIPIPAKEKEELKANIPDENLLIKKFSDQIYEQNVGHSK